MKKILSFTLAVVLALSLLVGSAFASSGVGSYFTPDTFISWGDTNNPYTLSVPSVAINGRNYIVYQVRDWALSYLRVRFVIDSFDSDIVPVEGESVAGWIRYSGTWALGVNSALEPDYYSTSLYADDRYTFSKSFLHKPVFSNFDYYDADGQLIISGDTSGAADDSLMDLTLNDRTVIQVSRHLQGNDFVVARSSANSDQYKIWLFLPEQVEQGIVYEGSTEALYFTSEGTPVGGLDGTVLEFDLSDTVHVSLDLGQSDLDISEFPYIFARGRGTTSGVIIYATKEPLMFYFDSSSDSSGRVYVPAGSFYQTVTKSGVWNSSGFLGSENSNSFNISYIRDGGSVQVNYPIYDRNGNFVGGPTFSLSSIGFDWSPWLTMSTVLDITQYGDIVYQSFNYSASAPEESPSPAPDNTPDGSNNGLFGWLREQWVFLMGRLTGVVDAINALADKLDPFPDQTTPILNNFFNVVFPNRITDTDINNIDIALDRFAGWFDTGYTFADFFDLFNQDYFLNWFTDDTKNALDTVGGAE